MAPVTFQDLQEEFSKLNRETDEELNAIIMRYNDQLGSLRAGIEVWLTNSPVENDEWGNAVDANDDPTGYEICRATLLGYCRVSDGWVLAVRTCNVINEDPNYPRPLQSYKVRDRSNPTPLLTASREERIKALDLIPELFESLKSEAQKMRKSIAEARAAVGKKLSSK